jgi:hypothetical protein
MKPAKTAGECVYGILHIEEVFLYRHERRFSPRGQNDQGTK